MFQVVPRLLATAAIGVMLFSCTSAEDKGGTGGSGAGGKGGSGTGGSASGGSPGSGGSVSTGGAGGKPATGGSGGAKDAGGKDASGGTVGKDGAAGETGGAKMAVATIAASGGGTITGTVTFVEVAGGVQVTYAIENCPPGNHPTHIHAGNGCGSPGAQGMHWDSPRGDNIGPAGGQITCGADSKGTLVHMRPNMPGNARWTIGDGSGTDVVGHPIIVHGVNNPDQRHGCGIITLK